MKRTLTDEEIEYILDFLQPNRNIPIESALSIIKNLKLRFINQLKTVQIYPELIDELKKQVEKNYRESLIHPGESVGIIAAQSIGEKNTQNTLNSVDWKEKILYMKNNISCIEPIGQMIDNILLKYPGNIEKIEENRTEYLKLKDGYFIPSCDEYGNTGWYKIEAITKHLPVGDLVQVTTESGRTVIATQSKSFLVWNKDENKFIATQGSDIKLGDILPTTEGLKRLNSIYTEFIEYKDKKIKLDRETGYIIGLSITDNIDTLLVENDIKDRYDEWFKMYKDIAGNFVKDITRENNVPDFIFTSRDECIKGFLSGYFRNCTYNNGNINAQSSYKDIIHGICFLLTYFKVFCHIENSTITIKSDYTDIFEKKVIEEIWKDVHPSFLLKEYQVSNLGRIKNKYTGYISKIKPRKDTNTIQYAFKINNKKKAYYANVLVCKTFNSEINECVDHINRIKSDNRLSNLRWVSYSKNSKNKIHIYKKGKKVDQFDLQGKFIKTWDKISEVEETIGISHSNIIAVINGRKPHTNGFIWKYNIEFIEGEIWKQIPIEEIETTYISNFGRIKRRNLDYTITYGSLRKDGYYTISIELKNQPGNIKRKKSKGFSVHRLVALTFIENIENKPFVNHIDEDKSNNKVTNLEWVTNSENINHSLNLKNRKVNNVLQKIILQIDPKTNYIVNKFSSFVEASEKLKIKKSGIQACVYNKQKTSYGYIWRIEDSIIENDISDKHYKTYFDKVININYVKGTTDYVYDLTVEKTRNFQLFNGLNIRDTFFKG
jgi:hypothetical protein